MNKEYQDWKITECKIAEDGLSMEIQFVHERSKISQHRCSMSSDAWFKGQFAVLKLAELEEAFRGVRDLLEGRR